MTNPADVWPRLRWKIGVEAELMAPRGASRATLAEHLATARGGRVLRGFLAQTEPSKAVGVEVFDNLTLAFRVVDADGDWIASCVDDLTLQVDLDRSAAPQPGWYRIVSDDRRLLHLVMNLGSAEGDLDQALAPIAAAFGTEVERFPGGMRRVRDVLGAPVVLGAPLPGERERPCELVTAPMATDHGATLDALLAPARALGFFVPRESATHVHFDAAPLRSATAVRSLVRLWDAWGRTLRALVGTNPACRQLGGWPDGLARCVEAPAFVRMPWEQARAALSEVGLSKFCDLNLLGLVSPLPGKETIEVRVLPGSIDTAEILHGAALFEAVLRHAMADAPVERQEPRKVRPRSTRALLEMLPLAPEERAYWLAVTPHA